MNAAAAGHGQPLRKSEILAGLPAPWPDEGLRGRIQRGHAARAETLVVIDDDPTGCQTVADVPLLFDWSLASLSAELAARPAVLYVLTNSRSKPAAEAYRLNQELAVNLRAASQQTGRAISLVSRSDSTLRGHFPAETDALAAGLGPFAGILLAPYFGDGGRLTIGDIHYVQRGDELIPAAATEFARDPVFGYSHSNLRDWAVEKSGGRWQADEILSLSLDDIRVGGPGQVAQRLAQASDGRPIVVNAASDRDLEVVAWALLQPEPPQLGGQLALLPRTAASFVKIRAGLPDRPLLSIEALELEATTGRRGGLILVGSFVPQTTAQLEQLLALPNVRGFELDVPGLLAHTNVDPVSRQLAAAAAQAMAAGHDAVIYTSRAFTSPAGRDGALAAGRTIGAALCGVLRTLPLRPAYVIAKGGITSHELAQIGLGCQRATVLGQIATGVPVWRLDRVERFENLPYVVFPGNVGQPGTLSDLVARLADR